MGDTNTQKAIRAWSTPAPEIEATLQAVLLGRSVDTAVGAQLDAIGKIVGRSRNGVVDDEIYRRLVRAQITANKSSGIIEDVITVALLVVNDPAAVIAIDNTGAAAYVLRVEGVAISHDVAVVLVELVLKATAGAARVIVEWAEVDPATVLRWDTQGVWDTAVWGNAADEEL